MQVQDWHGHLKERTRLLINGKDLFGQMSAVWSEVKVGGAKWVWRKEGDVPFAVDVVNPCR